MSLYVFSLTLKIQLIWCIKKTIKNSRSEGLGDPFSPIEATSGHPSQCPTASWTKKGSVHSSAYPTQQCKNHSGPPNNLAHKAHNAQGAPGALPVTCPFPLVPYWSRPSQLSAEVVRENTPSPAMLLSLPLAKRTHPSEASPLGMIFSFCLLPYIPSLRETPLPLGRGAFTRQKTALFPNLMDSSLLRRMLRPHLKLSSRPQLPPPSPSMVGHTRVHTRTRARRRGAQGRLSRPATRGVQPTGPGPGPLSRSLPAQRPRPRAHPQSGAGHQRQSGSEAR